MRALPGAVGIRALWRRRDGGGSPGIWLDNHSCFGGGMQSVWKILAPIALNEQSGPAVEHAIDVAEATRSELFLLHVLDRRLYKEASRAGWPSEPIGMLEGSAN